MNTPAAGKLREEELQEFIKIYKAEFGGKLSLKEAREMGDSTFTSQGYCCIVRPAKFIITPPSQPNRQARERSVGQWTILT